MKKNSWPVLFALFSVAAVAICGAEEPYHFLKEIPVGGEGGWDYLSIDESARRLYVSHQTKVVVIDLEKEVVVGEITNTPGVHGLAPAPDLGRGFASNGQENKASIVDLQTLQTLSKVDTGRNPDGMLYEPGRREVYMFNGGGQSATVIDAKSGKVVATVPIGAGVDANAFDPGTQLAFASCREGVVTIAHEDTPDKLTVVQTLKTEPGSKTMALDTKTHKIYLAAAKFDAPTGGQRRGRMVPDSFKILVYGM